MAKKSPFRSNYMFSQDYIDELTVRELLVRARSGNVRGLQRV